MIIPAFFWPMLIIGVVLVAIAAASYLLGFWGLIQWLALGIGTVLVALAIVFMIIASIAGADGSTPEPTPTPVPAVATNTPEPVNVEATVAAAVNAALAQVDTDFNTDEPTRAPDRSWADCRATRHDAHASEDITINVESGHLVSVQWWVAPNGPQQQSVLEPGTWTANSGILTGAWWDYPCADAEGVNREAEISNGSTAPATEGFTRR